MIKYFLLFLVLASPLVFRTVRKVLGTWVASAEGLPTGAGLALHAFIFALLSTRVISMYGRGRGGDGRLPPQYYQKRMMAPPPPPPPPEDTDAAAQDDSGTSAFFQKIFGSYI